MGDNQVGYQNQEAKGGQVYKQAVAVYIHIVSDNTFIRGVSEQIPG